MIVHYEWTDFGRFLAIAEAYCAIDCFEYQSCEHPDWWASGTHHFCHRFRAALAACLAGYEEAEAHWTTEKALARARMGCWRPLG